VQPVLRAFGDVHGGLAVNRLPDRSNLDHLKKQAKDLLRACRARDPQAIAQLRAALPAASGRSDEEIIALDLRLHDAQSCIARSYGFASLADLRAYVEAEAGVRDDRAALRLRWLALIYAGDLSGSVNRANPRVALRMLAESPDLVAGDPHAACAVGDEAALKAATATDPGWVNRPGGPLHLPPLLAVTHSSLLRVPEFRERLHACARHLLAAGADPNQRVGNRWPPASLHQPDDNHSLSALYGAAGVNHDPVLTKLLLEAGTDPNDNESLYHSLESVACVRALLEHGACIAGSNAMYRVLDLDNLAALELLLAQGGDANEPARNAPLTDWGSPLLWAIYRRRSRAHVAALLAAGASPFATKPDGTSAYSLALQFGLTEIAALLREHGASDALSVEEQFVAACAGGDEAEARRIQALRPDLPASLPEARLRCLPDMVAAGGDDGAKLMVRLGWPIAVYGGDWNASALNLAVFNGNAPLTRFRLEHGANWKEQHGFGDNACGTLSWASCNDPAAGGDWVGCAKALLDHGLPRAVPVAGDPDCVFIDGRRKRFSDEVQEVLLTGES
jgi:ankyrin repeat protein